MAKIRLFGYPGLDQIRIPNPIQYGGEGVLVAKEPYIWSQVIETNGGTPVPSVPQSPDGALVVKVEVPDGFAIRMEVNLSGPVASNAREAGDSSPRYEGTNWIGWANGASISIVDAASYT